MYGYGMGGIGMIIVWTVPLLLIVALVYFINSNKKETLSAKEILDKRYAKGEIDEQEYKRMRDALEQ
ncbi:MAG: SHOCT domain-containing protein [Sulfurimonadaceae bacterium]